MTPWHVSLLSQNMIPWHVSQNMTPWHVSQNMIWIWWHAPRITGVVNMSQAASSEITDVHCSCAWTLFIGLVLIGREWSSDLDTGLWLVLPFYWASSGLWAPLDLWWQHSNETSHLFSTFYEDCQSYVFSQSVSHRLTSFKTLSWDSWNTIKEC